MTQENKEVKRLLDWAVSNEWAWDLVWGLELIIILFSSILM